MGKLKGEPQPFVVDMRHDAAADPSYAVCSTWEGALARAGEFREGFDPRAASVAGMFKAGDGYDGRVDASARRGSRLYVSHAGGDGPCVRAVRAGR